MSFYSALLLLCFPVAAALLTELMTWYLYHEAEKMHGRDKDGNIIMYWGFW